MADHLPALNNTAARHWTNEGFSLVHKTEKYIFSERDGHEYYDLARDPAEKENLWTKLATTPPPWLAAAIAAEPAYAALLLRHTRLGDPLRQSVETAPALPPASKQR